MFDYTQRQYNVTSEVKIKPVKTIMGWLKRVNMVWKIRAATWLIELNDKKTSTFVRLLILGGVGFLLLAGTVLVHLTGGTPNENAHFMYVPIFLAAAAYGVSGGVAAGLLAGLLLGPVLGGSLESMQAIITSWGVRTLWFMALGTGAGILIKMLSTLGVERRRQALQDPSTGLPNQAALMEDLASRLALQEETKKHIAVVLLRATDFNEILEVFGIDDGDRIITRISQYLCQCCPEVKGCYRFGTSALALIMETENIDAAKRVARTLHNAAATSFMIDGIPVRIEPALGMGHIADDVTVHAQEVVRRARVALGRAVSLEKELVSFEPEFDTAKSATLELVARAEQGLHAGEFELHYQPKLRLADRQPAGAEALARWRRPDKGIVPPGSFMPKLERTSLIDEFSRFVIQTATHYAHTGSLVPVSINLAPRNLTDDSLADMLIECLRETGVPPECLEVEVTESGLMHEPESTARILGRLRDQGIKVSIDDFGTGYASFSYLRNLPVTGLKIDRAFIQPLEEDPKTRRLVLAMIEAGHALDLTVTAEGIETEEQAQILTDLGCDLGQGFLWSPALEETELHEWLKSSGFSRSA